MIYFIQQDTSGPIKIGYTNKHVRKRLSALQTGCSECLNLLGTIEGNRDVERQLHSQFKHMRGEWFHPTQELLVYIEEHATPSPLLPTETVGMPSREWIDRSQYVNEYTKWYQETEQSTGECPTEVSRKLLGTTQHAQDILDCTDKCACYMCKYIRSTDT